MLKTASVLAASAATASFTGAATVNYDSAGVGILYGYTANVKGAGTSTSHIVGAQLNAFSKNTTGTRSVFGAALEAWSGDHATAPDVTATLIGIEPAVISQYHDNSSPILGVDVVFKNRTDVEPAAKGGLGSNGYNKNSRAIQVSAQTRGTDTAYCGWKIGILFTADSIDRTVTAVDGCCIDMAAVDNTRLASAIRMPTSGAISWDSDARKLSVATGILLFNVSGTNVFQVNSSGQLSVTGEYRVSGTKVVGARDTGWTAMTGTANENTAYDTTTVTLAQLAGRVMALQAALTTHGLIGT